MITGAGGGLGRQYALLLARRGARVVVNDTGGSVTGAGSKSDTAAAVVDEIRGRGGKAIADTRSVATPEGGQAIVETAAHAWGRVDVVINNAGIVRDAPFDDVTADRLDPLVDVHLKGRVQREPAGVEADAQATLRPDTEHLLGRRTAGCTSDEQLRCG